MTPSSHEKALFTRCIKEAAAHPAAFVARIKAKAHPAFWEFYWAMYAADRLNDQDFLEPAQKEVLPDQMNMSDLFILSAYEQYLDPTSQDSPFKAYTDLEYYKDRISPLLQEALVAIQSLVPHPDTAPQGEPLHNFYTQELFVKRSERIEPEVLAYTEDEKSEFQLCMKEAAAHPADFLARIKAEVHPTYWEIYWAMYAAFRLEDRAFIKFVDETYIPAEDIDNLSGDNFYLLHAYGNYLDNLRYFDDEFVAYSVYDLLCCANGFISPLLQEAFDSLLSIVPGGSEVGCVPLQNFYTQELFVDRK